MRNFFFPTEFCGTGSCREETRSPKNSFPFFFAQFGKSKTKTKKVNLSDIVNEFPLRMIEYRKSNEKRNDTDCQADQIQ